MSFLDLYQGDQQNAATIQPNEGRDLPSGFADNFKASWSDGLLFSQSTAQANARSAVLGDYLDEVRQKTGNDLSQNIAPDIFGNPDGATNFEQVNPVNFDQVNARVADLKAKFPDLDLNPLSEDEINQRAVAKAQAAHRNYETLQTGEKGAGGSVGSFLGSTASSASDPVNLLALAVAPETGGIGILASALRWGAIAGVSQAAIEASSNSFKEQVQPGYTESGAPIENIAGAAVSGAVLGGGFKALGNLWSRVKTGQWPTSVRDAGNVIESEANVADSNPFPGVEGEVAHREALTKSIDDILAGRPVDVSGQITPDLLDRSRALIEKLQAEQPMALPVINRRAIELAAEQERLSARDTELQSQLFAIGPKEGYRAASDQLARVRTVEGQIASAATPEERKALSRRRDELLADTTPEKLQAAAAPIEQRRVLEAERASIGDRLDQITAEHANLQASTLPQMQLPPLGQRERIPSGPKGQFEFDLQPSTTAVPAEVSTGRQIEAYHGTVAQFDKFDFSKLGTATGTEDAKHAMFFTSDPQLAAQYASKPDFYRDSKLGRVLNAVTRGWYERLNEGIVSLFGISAKDRGFVKRVSLHLENPLEVDLKGDEYDEGVFTAHLLEAKRNGHDGVIFRNADDSFDGQKNIKSDVYAVFHPEKAQVLGTSSVERGVIGDERPAAPTEALSPKAVGPQPFTQTPEQMRETLTAPDHQDAIRADIDRARAMSDVQVPGVDENGNHTMLSVDSAMDQVDAYKAAAEQIQACANPIQEAAE